MEERLIQSLFGRHEETGVWEGLGAECTITLTQVLTKHGGWTGLSLCGSRTNGRVLRKR